MNSVVEQKNVVARLKLEFEHLLPNLKRRIFLRKFYIIFLNCKKVKFLPKMLKLYFVRNILQNNMSLFQKIIFIRLVMSYFSM